MFSVFQNRNHLHTYSAMGLLQIITIILNFYFHDNYGCHVFLFLLSPHVFISLYHFGSLCIIAFAVSGLCQGKMKQLVEYNCKCLGICAHTQRVA